MNVLLLISLLMKDKVMALLDFYIFERAVNFLSAPPQWLSASTQDINKGAEPETSFAATAGGHHTASGSSKIENKHIMYFVL